MHNRRATAGGRLDMTGGRSPLDRNRSARESPVDSYVPESVVMICCEPASVRRLPIAGCGDANLDPRTFPKSWHIASNVPHPDINPNYHHGADMAKHTPPEVEVSILRFLKKRVGPVAPSEILVVPEIGSSSTSSERRRAIWNLIDQGKIVLTPDRRLQRS